MFKKTLKLFLRIAFLLLAIWTYLYSVKNYIADTEIRGIKDVFFDIRTEEPVTVRAGSCEPFIWRNLETKEIFGDTSPSSPDLGYDCNQYYTTTKELTPGYWTKILGRAEFEVEKDKVITEVVPIYEVRFVYVILFFIFTVFWFIFDNMIFRKK